MPQRWELPLPSGCCQHSGESGWGWRQRRSWRRQLPGLVRGGGRTRVRWRACKEAHRRTHTGRVSVCASIKRAPALHPGHPPSIHTQSGGCIHELELQAVQVLQDLTCVWYNVVCLVVFLLPATRSTADISCPCCTFSHKFSPADSCCAHTACYTVQKAHRDCGAWNHWGLPGLWQGPEGLRSAPAQTWCLVSLWHAWSLETS